MKIIIFLLLLASAAVDIEASEEGESESGMDGVTTEETEAPLENSTDSGQLASATDKATDSGATTEKPNKDGGKSKKDSKKDEKLESKQEKKAEKEAKKDEKKADKDAKKAEKDDKKLDKKDIKNDTKPNHELILGHFRLESDPKDEDFNEFLKAMEYSDEDREKVRNSYSIMVDIEKGTKTDEYVYKVKWGFQTFTTKFIRDVEYDDKLYDGREYKAIVHMAGDTINRHEKHKNFNVTHDAKFNQDGFAIESTAKNKTAKQIYGRFDKFFDSKKVKSFSENMKKGLESLFG